MTDWAAFAGFSLAVLCLLLVLARLSVSHVDGPTLTPTDLRWLDALADGSDHLAASDAALPEAEPGTPERYPTGLFILNVTLSQGVFAGILLAAVFYTQVPLSALGISGAGAGTALAVGLVAGLGLSLLNALGGVVAGAFGVDPSADLRELLTPESALGWVLLLGVALPLVAGFEELLFRGVLVGGFAAGFGLSPWALAVLSSVAFAIGHGAQGPLGMAVTGALGFVLAAVFVITGSLLVVVVAHYVVNAAEFVGHELFRSPD